MSQAILKKLDSLARQVDKNTKVLDKQTKVLDKVAAVVVSLEDRTGRLEHQNSQIITRLDMVQNNQDWMIGELTKLDQERLAVIQSLKDYGERIEQLEEKIQRIEQTAA